MDNTEKLETQGTQDEEKQSKNTTQYVFHTTMRTLRHVPSYKQLQAKTNRTSFYAEIVKDITTRNLEHKDTYYRTTQTKNKKNGVN